MIDWISVSDRFPAPVGPSVMGSLMSVIGSNGTDVFEVNFNSYTGIFLGSDLLPRRDITHWMPLPEPPSELDKRNSDERLSNR